MEFMAKSIFLFFLNSNKITSINLPHDLGQVQFTALFFCFHLFIFWLCRVFVAVHGLSLFVESRSYSLVVVLKLVIAAASLAVERKL